jgi:trans-2,3-dihydro-3-hydroxyanthranilate isomerase
MAIRVLHVEAFSHQPGMGNPAGVVLDAGCLDEARMQEIARAVGFSETVFVLPSDKADVRLRYFTPGHEVDLCGHATVAAFVTLYTRGLLPEEKTSQPLTFETRAGVLPISVNRTTSGEVLVEMTQAPSQFLAFKGDQSAVAGVLGIEAEDIHQELPLVYGYTGLWTLVVPVRDLAVIRKMQPRNQDFPPILGQMPDASIHLFCLETINPEATMHGRHFSSPRSGTVEDPVTGTASGVLGAYYREFISSAQNEAEPFLVEQGQEIGRDGRVKVWATKQIDGYAVRIAGTGCFVRELIID